MAHFARELADALERGRTDHRYERLILVAPSKFLGALHDQFDEPLRRCVIGEVHRDISTLSPSEIHDRVARLLEPVVPRSASV
jgi:protein required for attachment to host cells